MKCHYEVLDVPQNAEEAEIKTAYKKLALKWHPDKNLNNPDEAKEQFQLVQQAYEVLSDRQERAWYDNHREQILRGSNKDYEDNSLDVFQYFTTSCFKGYNDDEKGFYTIYRKVFEDIAKEDLEYIKKEDFCEIPSFGNSSSDYEGVVGPFYNYWLSYSTKKSYVWLDPYNINEIRERRAVKIIEKENKKIRAKAKKERNEEVRNLVAFVKKRDKRVQAHAKKMEEKAKENKLKQEELSKQKRMERRKEMHENSKQAEWAKFDNVQSELAEIEKNLAEQFGEEFSNSEDEDFEEEILDDLYCVACNKVFKTPKAFENHEASKKHKENIERLKEEMLEDEEEENDEGEDTVSLDEGEEKVNVDEEILDEDLLDDDILEEEVVEVKSKKKGKNKKKVVSVLEIEEDVLPEVISVEQEDDVDFNTKKSKKKDKKKKNKNNENKTTEVTEENGVKEMKEEEIEEVVKTKKGKKAKDKRKKGGDEDFSEPIDKDHSCISCKANFDSKNKLFEHLKKTGHSVLLAKAPAATAKTKKKSIK